MKWALCHGNKCQFHSVLIFSFSDVVKNNNQLPGKIIICSKEVIRKEIPKNFFPVSKSRYGTSFVKSLSVLYNEGGIGRLYRGVSFALFQAPLSRFVSTAANDGVEALLAGLEFTSSWGVGRSTVVASIVVGFWRMMLMPLDTCKTVLQVDSKEGFRNLMRRVRAGKIGVLYSGCVANALSSMFGHYPW